MKKLLVIFGLLVSLPGGGTAEAYQLTNKLESLVMPGPVSRHHLKYEEKCASCHAPLGDRSQRSLCLDCHENVGKDIDQATGFHGRHPSASVAECKSCHTDHEGREADILGLNRETFNHDMTDFRLTGKHAALSCDQCHQPAKKFHDAKSDCFSCHEKDDAHRGDMGRACDSCHGTAGWREVKFDHAKTKFPLTGHHEKVACKGCHPDTRYKQTPRDCIACHANNDRHERRFGNKCADCHSPQSWTTTSFDHGRDAKFRLQGVHGELACEACHTSLSPKTKPPKKCNDCHASVDIHRGRNGTECQTCHTEDSWKKARFSHDKDTKFALTGAHQKVECFSCHRGEPDRAGAVRTCIDCHQPDDAHNGKLGSNCQACHSDTAWTQNIRFDHDLTQFPLIGLHAIAACDDCHVNREFKGAKTECVACHAAEDSHKRALGTACAACHNPNGWNFWQFDHNKQTDFALDGSHAGLACNACHRQPADGEKIKTGRNCVDCHRADDIHNGQFGTSCNRCHITETFKSIRMGR